MDKLKLHQAPIDQTTTPSLHAEIGNNLSSFAHDLLQGITTSKYITSVDQLAPYTSGISSDITPDTQLKTTTVKAIVTKAEQELAGATRQGGIFAIVFRTLQHIFDELGIDSAYGLLSRRTNYNSNDKNVGGALSLFNLIKGDQGPSRPLLKAMQSTLPTGSFHISYSYLTSEGLKNIATSWFVDTYISLSDMQRMIDWLYKSLRHCGIVDQETLRGYRVTDKSGDQSLLSNSISLVRVLQGAQQGLGSYIKLLVLLMEYHCNANAAKGERISEYLGYHGNPNSKAITHINEPGKQFLIQLTGLVPNYRYAQIIKSMGETAADADIMSRSIADFHKALAAMEIHSLYSFEQTIGEYDKVYTCFKNTILKHNGLFQKYNTTQRTGFDRSPSSITLPYVLDILTRTGLPFITPYQKLSLDMTLKRDIRQKLNENGIRVAADINRLHQDDFRAIISSLTGGYKVVSQYQQLKYLFPEEYFETFHGPHQSSQIRKVKAAGRQAIKQRLLK